MPDEKDLHDPRNPIYEPDVPKEIEERVERIMDELDAEEEKHAVVSPEFKKRKKIEATFPKLKTSTTSYNLAIGNGPLPHFETDERNTDNTGTSK